MKKDIKLGNKALKAKKAVEKAGKTIKGFLASIKEVNIKIDLEEKICNIEIKGK